MYPIYCRKEVQDTLNTYARDIKKVPYIFQMENIDFSSNNYTAEKYIELYDKQTSQDISPEELTRILLDMRKHPILSEECQTVVDELLNNPQWFDKIKLCFDGSYRNNRIWEHFSRDMELELTPEVSFFSQDISPEVYKDLDTIATLHWLFDNFNIVFLQMPHYQNFQEEISRKVQWENDVRELDKFLFDNEEYEEGIHDGE